MWWLRWYLTRTHSEHEQNHTHLPKRKQLTFIAVEWLLREYSRMFCRSIVINTLPIWVIKESTHNHHLTWEWMNEIWNERVWPNTQLEGKMSTRKLNPAQVNKSHVYDELLIATFFRAQNVHSFPEFFFVDFSGSMMASLTDFSRDFKSLRKISTDI